MRNLKYGSRGFDVRTLELFLRDKGYHVIVDPIGKAHYGPNLANAVYWYQKNEGLYPDKMFGPKCKASMESASMCRYQEVAFDRQTTMIRMDKRHTKLKVLNPFKMTLKQMWRKLTNSKASLVINGTLFNMANYGDAAGLRVEGVDVGWGFYDDDGLCVNRDGRAYAGKKEGSYEFMGGSPAVLIDGKVNTEFDNLSDSFVESKHPRTMVQINKDYINVFIIRGRSRWRGWYGASFELLVKYAKTMAKYDEDDKSNAINFDGGYSTGAYTLRGRVFGWISRYVANGLAFFVEGM